LLLCFSFQVLLSTFLFHCPTSCLAIPKYLFLNWLSLYHSRMWLIGSGKYLSFRAAHYSFHQVFLECHSILFTNLLSPRWPRLIFFSPHTLETLLSHSCSYLRKFIASSHKGTWAVPQLNQTWLCRAIWPARL
jgi:hypothetical protein